MILGKVVYNQLKEVIMEYIVAQNGATEFLVLRLIGEIYHVIARSGNRDYAEQIVAALTGPVEVRMGWNDR